MAETTQTPPAFAEAELLGPTRSAFLHNRPAISTVVPSANAQVLRGGPAISTVSRSAYSNSMAPATATQVTQSTVATSVVATPFAAAKPLTGPLPPPTRPPPNNNTATVTGEDGTTTTVTTYPASAPTESDAAMAVRLARMKQRRKGRQVVAATTGAVTGLVVFGPIGAAVGGIVAHTVVKGTGRAVERRVRKQHEASQKGVEATPVNDAAIAASQRNVVRGGEGGPRRNHR
mmetsp:Transcript_3554/g.6055  ORF Transcript_3554/g.6055 Transcript_3554/m.6055 type:complete len:232 (-) Transcript_3554:291-986(-)